MRRLTESEMLFLSVFMLSAFSLVPAAMEIYDRHRTIAIVLLAGTGVLTLFVLYLLWRGRPRRLPL